METKAAAIMTGRKKESRKKYNNQLGIIRFSASARISPIETLKVTAKKVKRSVFHRICTERRSEKNRTKLSNPTHRDPIIGSKYEKARMQVMTTGASTKVR